MFGFVSKFKKEVVNGFTAVHQRLVTLEAKVDALFHHNQVVATQATPIVEPEVKEVPDAEHQS